MHINEMHQTRLYSGGTVKLVSHRLDILDGINITKVVYTG